VSPPGPSEVKPALRCQSCSRELPATSPDGLCVACLLASALTLSSEPDPEETSALRLASPDALLDQRQLGDYELREILGRGGMGVVFRAHHRGLKRTVALKVIASGELASAAAKARFRREAEAAAALDHPNIVPIYEIGEHSGWPYFSMRLVEGRTLAEVVARGPVDSKEAASLVATLARALHHAHQRGVLHRDIKPENVILDDLGQPHLTDFGLARRFDDERLTVSNVVLGTPGFLAPEQAVGDSTRITTATDIHGIGAILFFLLTGRPPFEGGTTAETLTRVLVHDVPSLRSLNPRIHHDLATICEACLRKDPRRRYATAEAVAVDLEQWLLGAPIAARPATAWELVLDWLRRRPVVASSLALILTGLLGTITLLGVTNRSILAARNQAIAHAEENRRHLVDVNVVLGNQLTAVGEGHAALLRFVEAIRLEHGDPVAEDVHRRRFAAILHSNARLAHIAFMDGFVHNVAFSPDGSQLIACSEDRTIRAWDTATGKPLMPVVRLEHEPYRVGFDHEGTRFVSADASMMMTWRDLRTQEIVGPPHGPILDFRAFTITSDKRWILARIGPGVGIFSASNPSLPVVELPDTAQVLGVWTGPPPDLAVTTSENGWVHCWRVPGGQRVGVPFQAPDPLNIVAISPNAQHVAMASGGLLQSITIWDVATGTRRAGPFKPGGDLFDLAYSPDGKRLAVCSWDGHATLLDAETCLPVTDRMRHRRGIGRSRFSPDNRWLVTASWDKTARLWDARTGVAASPVLHHAGYVMHSEFHPQSSLLATAGGDHTIRLWQLDAPGSASLVLKHSNSVTTGSFSRDGTQILTADFAGFVRAWDSSRGTTLHAWKHPAAVPDCHFDSQGEHILTACQDGKARLWSVHSESQPDRVFDHGAKLSEAHFSPDEHLILTAGADGIARVWRRSDGALITQTAAHQERIADARFSPDGQRIVTGSNDGTARVWNALTGEPVSPPITHVGQVWTVAFSQDGRQILTACADDTQRPRAAQLWDAETGQPIGNPLAHADGVIHATFSPDGRLIATSGEDTTTRIWDARTSQLVSSPLSHGSYTMQAKFSPNSRLLLTASADGTARVWDVRDGQPVTPPLSHNNWIGWGCWSPDGLRVLTGSGDGIARVWEVGPATGPVAELQRQAEVLSARRLDPTLGLIELTRDEIRERWEAGRREN
jgi:WD40 repeat protein